MFALSLKMPLYKCRKFFHSHTFLLVTESVSLKVEIQSWPDSTYLQCPYLLSCAKGFIFSPSHYQINQTNLSEACEGSVQHPGLKS